MSRTITETDYLRAVSAFFTPAVFRRALSSSDQQTKLLSRMSNHRRVARPLRVASHLRGFYSSMRREYCNEYVYKNELLHSELLSKHCLSDTTVLNEFRIGSSIADFVLLNGEIRVFEIKSDLDNLDKLGKQVEDYRKIANRVFIVSSERYCDRIVRRFASSPVGVLVYSGDGGMFTLKEADLDNGKLSHLALYKTLRKPEYLALTKEIFGELPSVPNTQIFSACFALLSQLPVEEFQVFVREVLKGRSLKCPELLVSDRLPSELKHICYTLDLSAKQYEGLFSLLDIVN
jgi:hypothetical protein